jgi:hypothetical protein
MRVALQPKPSSMVLRSSRFSVEERRLWQCLAQNLSIVHISSGVRVLRLTRYEAYHLELDRSMAILGRMTSALLRMPRYFDCRGWCGAVGTNGCQNELGPPRTA